MVYLLSFKLSRVGPALGLLSALALPAQADLCLSYRLDSSTTRLRTNEVFQHESTRRLCLDEWHARLDIGAVLSYIVDLDHHNLQLLDHDKHTIENLSLPVALGGLLTGDLAEAHASFSRMVAPNTIDEEVATTLEVIGRWKVRKYRLSVATRSEYSFVYETWTTRDIPLAGGMQKALHVLLRSYYELDSPTRPWIDRALERPGVPVRMNYCSNDGRLSREKTWLLQEVSDLSPESTHFQAPANYAEKPFDVTRFVNLVTPTIPAPPS